LLGTTHPSLVSRHTHSLLVRGEVTAAGSAGALQRRRADTGATLQTGRTGLQVAAGLQESIPTRSALPTLPALLPQRALVLLAPYPACPSCTLPYLSFLRPTLPSALVLLAPYPACPSCTLPYLSFLRPTLPSALVLLALALGGLQAPRGRPAVAARAERRGSAGARGRVSVAGRLAVAAGGQEVVRSALQLGLCERATGGCSVRSLRWRHFAGRPPS